MRVCSLVFVFAVALNVPTGYAQYEDGTPNLTLLVPEQLNGLKIGDPIYFAHPVEACAESSMGDLRMADFCTTSGNPIEASVRSKFPGRGDKTMAQS